MLRYKCRSESWRDIRRQHKSALAERMATQHRTDIQLSPRARWSRKGFLEALSKIFSSQREPLKTERYTCYDSPDLQLSLYRLSLAMKEDRLTLQSYDGALPVEEITCHTAPTCVMDVPNSRIRQHLLERLGNLPLTPVFVVQEQKLMLRILDQHQKTTVRMIIEEASLVKKACSGPLQPRIWIRPLRGYRKEAKQVLRWCAEHDLSPTVTSVSQEALAQLGRSPGKYSVKRPLPLRPDLHADDAARRLLRLLLAMVKYNERGMRHSDDPLYLHDFRIAIRRARSLLSQTRAVFPQDETKQLRKELAVLGRSTGNVRDLDALLLVQDAYQKRLPTNRQSALQPFWTFVQQQRMEHYHRLTKAFETKRYKATIQHWEAFAAEPDKPDHNQPSVESFVLECLRDKGRSVLSRDPDSLLQADSEELHTLRIECKKLRYLFDFFITAFPDLPIRDVLKQLKRVQRTLGRIQDISVQVAFIRQFSDATLNVASNGRETRQALELLLTSLVSEQQDLQPSVAQEFQALSTRLSGLIAPEAQQCDVPQEQQDQSLSLGGSDSG